MPSCARGREKLRVLSEKAGEGNLLKLYVFIYVFIGAFIYVFIDAFVNVFIGAFIYVFIDAFIYVFIDAFLRIH